MRVVLNLAPARALPLAVLRTAALLLVNEDEAAELAVHTGCGANAAALHEALGVTVIRTLGSEGAEAAGPQGPVRVAAPRVRAVDTTAAGDCFAGTLAAGLLRHGPLHTVMARACAAAALACTVAGSQRSLPTAEGIDSFLR